MKNKTNQTEELDSLKQITDLSKKLFTDKSVNLHFYEHQDSLLRIIYIADDGILSEDANSIMGYLFFKNIPKLNIGDAVEFEFGSISTGIITSITLFSKAISYRVLCDYTGNSYDIIPNINNIKKIEKLSK